MGGDCAPGGPGIPPRWTSSAKSGVGTSLNPNSRVWFTLSHGILNEVYYPRIDRAAIRDLGLIITGEGGFFSEEKRDARSWTEFLTQGVPAYRSVNTCLQGRYRLEKAFLADPRRDVILQHIRFTPLQGKAGEYRLYALLAPHLDNHGMGNRGWVGDYKGTPMLFAERDGDALALACSTPWSRASAGFVGTSDGWQELRRHGELHETWCRAENGNIALTGEIDPEAAAKGFVLALGFGRNAAEAGHRALASLLGGFAEARSAYVEEWQEWLDRIHPLPRAEVETPDLFRLSACVLRTHEAKRFPGGLIASLSIPWGFAKGDDDLGGYHLVWPRDLVEAAGGLMAAGAGEDVRRILNYLRVTQEADGHWAQNMWLDGTPYWVGVQMDETALPILLVDLARREGALNGEDLERLWPMVRDAAGYVARNGPVTQEDRWEEDPGYSPFTLAAEIAALLAAADLAEQQEERELADFLREEADLWYACIDRWIYVTDTDLSRQQGVEGYYVRIAPPEVGEAASPKSGFVPIKNRPPGESCEPAACIVSPDALALVRFGLRSADDPRIVNTVRVIDALLKVDMPQGPAWHRYNDDGYGEHGDGSAFDGTGCGRAWPLLTGERAHFELAAGRKEEACRLLEALERFAGDSGLLPEQVWDDVDRPDRELFTGRPSGSAMPLVWAHAEYIKLRRSLHENRVFDQPPQPAARYRGQSLESPIFAWRFNHKCRRLPAGKKLRFELLAPAIVHWSSDGWGRVTDLHTIDTGLGLHVVDLPTGELAVGAVVVFTFFWSEAGRWEGTDYSVEVE